MLDARGILDGVRRDVADYTLNKIQLYRPRAITPLRTPSGQTLDLPSPAAGGLGLPNANTMRLWPFHIDESGLAQAGVAISPQFSGPALIRSIAFLVVGGGGTPHPSFQLYYDTDSGGGGSNQNAAIEPSGTPVWEKISIAVDAAFAVQAGAGVLTETEAAAPAWRESFIDKFVPLAAFFLKARLVSANAGSQRAEGWVRVIENYNPLLAAGF